MVTLLRRWGIAEEEAWAMSPGERLARFVVNVEFEGYQWFDWDIHQWRERR